MGEKVTTAISKMRDGDIILLDNIRIENGEKKKDENFAKRLAELADIYVNEDFPVSHREDTSIVLLPNLLPSYVGFQFEKEVKNLSKVVHNPKHPFLFILGGAKFSTKMPLIEKYLKLAEYIFIGGALSNDFLKVKGYEVGYSLVSENNYGIAELLKNKKLILPTDVLVKSRGKLMNKKVEEIGKEDVILDIGPDSVDNLSKIIKKAKMILWNGPLGKYEDGGAEATKKVLKLISKSKAKSIIGGGDTVALISEMKMEKKFSFVSTGGGATLDFLAHGTLPGIKVLE